MLKNVFTRMFVFKSLVLIASFSVIFGSACFALAGEGIQVYQKNLHLSPTNKKKLAADISRYRQADNIWDVLREQFSLPHYERHPVVQERIVWYLNNQDYILRAASRAAPYLYYIHQQVKKRHLPAELVLLPIIESGYNPFAISYMGASGLWQMMPTTANDRGIRQDSLYDGRRDIIASTRGALNHLAYLQNFFDGNWLLAIAAYNTGEGNVLAAIKRNIRDGKRTEFWSLPLAQQTKDYVPSLLALATIISHPEKYQIYFPPVRNAPYLAQIDVGQQINLKYAASLAGISVKKITELNPGFNSYTISRKGPHKLVLPIENVEQFSENLAHSPVNTKYNWIHYKVKSSDSLVAIAKKFNLTITELQQFNRLKTNKLKTGLELFIPEKNETPIPALLAMANKTEHKPAMKPKLSMLASSFNKSKSKQKTNSVQKYILQPGDTIYMIRANDTVASVANKFHVNTQVLVAANGLNANNFIPGKQIIVPTHVDTEPSQPDSKNVVQPGDTIYMVRKDDTLEKIAFKFRITEAEIRVANLMAPRKLKEGERLIIPTHLNG